MPYAIETFELTKEFILTKNFYPVMLCRFKKRKVIPAVHNVTLRIQKGELFGLIGPNGAGKTTLIKILSGLIVPTKGTAKILGYDILKNEEKVKTLIGLISGDERSFYGRLSLRQNLYFFSALYNLSGSQAKRKIDELSSLLEIVPQLDQRFQECSTGIKQRIAIARGLIHNPQILFMDEPTKSLDPITRKNLRNFIKESLVKGQGKTVLFTTHNLSEIDNFADRIAIMSLGRIEACGTLTELGAQINSPQARIEEIYDKLIKTKEF